MGKFYIKLLENDKSLDFGVTSWAPRQPPVNVVAIANGGIPQQNLPRFTRWFGRVARLPSFRDFWPSWAETKPVPW